MKTRRRLEAKRWDLRSKEVADCGSESGRPVSWTARSLEMMEVASRNCRRHSQESGVAAGAEFTKSRQRRPPRRGRLEWAKGASDRIKLSKDDQ